MRRILYEVAASLDGYIAGPRGEFDWIPMDPEIDFAAMFTRFDTLLMGRRTYAALAGGGGGGGPMGTMRTVVFSSTLSGADHPGATIVSGDSGEFLDDLREQPGKDIWLFGGGALFGNLLRAGQVDGVTVAIVPVLLGGGVPLLSGPGARAKLKLVDQKVYGRTGTVMLEYEVDRGR